MSWLTELLLQNEEFESPLNFIWWSGLTAISAVVKDNVWVDRHAYKLYPNIFVILYADSGLKKGPPIALAKRLVELVNKTSKPPVTKVISGRSSIQGILKELGTSQTVPGGHINLKSTGFLCFSEMSAALVKDEAAFDILTDLHDRIYYEEKYESILKQEKFSLNKPTVQLLAGINPAHADALFARKDVHGGYIGRSFIIHESKRNRINSLIYKPKVLPDNEKNAAYLKQLSRLHGQFEDLEGTPTGELYDEWYIEFVKSIEKGNIKDPTGTLNRFSESVMKVAMLISLANRPELVIEKKFMQEAIERCEKIIAGVRQATSGQGKSQFAEEMRIVIDELLARENHMISREQLIKKFYLRATSTQWDEIMNTLIGAGIVVTDMVANVLVFKMPDKEVERISNHLRGK